VADRSAQPHLGDAERRMVAELADDPGALAGRSARVR
jgi:hypothetical protein